MRSGDEPVIRVTLVGAGRWGANLARALKELEVEGSVELGYVVDTDVGRAEELRGRYGFRGVSATLDDIAGDAIVIATSIESLYPTAMKAMDVARCVFVEKPAATSSRQALELLAKAKARGVVHQVGYISRFDPVVSEVKKWLGELPPYSLRFRRLSRRPSHMVKYPVTLDLMSHDVDLAFYLVGQQEPRVLFSLLIPDDVAPQRAFAAVEYGSVDVLLEADGVLPAKVREVEVLSERGLLRADLVSRTLLVKRGSETVTVSVADQEEPLRRELRTFVERCSGRELEAPDLDDALRVLRVLEGVHASSKTLRRADENFYEKPR